MRPLHCVGSSFTILQLDKSTQTDESSLDRTKGGGSGGGGGGGSEQIDAPTTDIKIEKVIRQRLQRTQRGENSVSSQTLSPIHHHGKFCKISFCHIHEKLVYILFYFS